jgi:hypothetical protein
MNEPVIRTALERESVANERERIGLDGQISVIELSPWLIVGEIALLRHAPRTAALMAKDDVCG